MPLSTRSARYMVARSWLVTALATRPTKNSPALAPYMDWGLAFSQNLRHLRNTGYDAKAVAALTSNAEKACATVNARNGWTPPTGPNLTPFTP